MSEPIQPTAENAGETKPSGGLFADRALPAAPRSVAAPPAPARPRRWLMPLIVFVLMIGGIAWLVQNMPRWREPKKREAPPVTFTELVKYETYLAFWDDPKKAAVNAKKEPQLYAREFERGDNGQYFYPISNISGESLQMGLVRKRCDCASLALAIVSESEWKSAFEQIKAYKTDVVENPAWTWQTLQVGENQGVDLPAGAHALLRMSWATRKEPNSPLNVGATIWARTSIGKRQDVDIFAPAIAVRPLLAMPDHANLGTLGPGEFGAAEFKVWSATRDQLNFTVKEPNNDPLFKIKVEPLTPSQCEALQVKLRSEGVNTRVRCAFDVKVKVLEQEGSNQLDQGQLHRSLELTTDDAAGELPSLLIQALVKGDIQVGAAEDKSKVDFKSFLAKDGTRKTVVLWADLKTDLAIDKHLPAGVEVSLKESTGEKTATRRKWLLEVVVPPNQHFGPFDPTHAIILRTNANPPRRIRIPMTGNAVQG